MMTTISQIIDLAKDIQALENDIDKKNKEIMILKQRHKNKDSSKRQHLIEVGLSILRLQNDSTLGNEVHLEQIFIEDSSQNAQHLRANLGELVKLLDFLYGKDITEPIPEEHLTEIESMMNRNQ